MDVSKKQNGSELLLELSGSIDSGTSPELNAVIDEVFNRIKPTSIKDMGSIMKEVKPLVNGKADMKHVNELIKEKLN